jgi:hypothetical protein
VAEIRLLLLAKIGHSSRSSAGRKMDKALLSNGLPSALAQLTNGIVVAVPKTWLQPPKAIA